MPGARPAFAAAGFSAAMRRRPPDSVPVPKGGPPAMAAAPQKKGGEAGALGGTLQAAPRHERQSPDLADDRDKTGGAQPFLDRPQDVLVTRRRDDDEAGGIEAVRQKSRPVQIGPLHAPQHRPPAEAGQEGRRKDANRGGPPPLAPCAKGVLRRAQGETAARQHAV